MSMRVPFTLPAGRRRAFTLIELLVVIAIIGILSSVVLASLNSAREKAGVVSIAQELKEIEKALSILAIDEGITEWWGSGSFGSTVSDGRDDYVPLSTMVADADRLGAYLSSTPTPYSGTEYGYDKNTSSGTFPYDNGCFTSLNWRNEVRTGANIYIRNLSTSVREQLDEVIDGGDGSNCGGKIFLVNFDTAIYKLSFDGSF